MAKLANCALVMIFVDDCLNRAFYKEKALVSRGLIRECETSRRFVSSSGDEPFCIYFGLHDWQLASGPESVFCC